jgi:hypothetical protein
MIFWKRQNGRFLFSKIGFFLARPITHDLKLLFQLAIVNRTLSSDGNEVSVVLADGGLVRDWLKCRRLLVVVESKGEVIPTQALFIYTAQTLPIVSVKDLALESVVPIDQDFK